MHYLVRYPTMHHFVTEMCTYVHISVTKWGIVGYGTGALWDLCNMSIIPVGDFIVCLRQVRLLWVWPMPYNLIRHGFDCIGSTNKGSIHTNIRHANCVTLRKQRLLFGSHIDLTRQWTPGKVDISLWSVMIRICQFGFYWGCGASMGYFLSPDFWAKRAF